MRTEGLELMTGPGSVAGAKIALVHDDLVQAGGAERVAAAFHTFWPQAPLFTSVYDPESTLTDFRDADVRTSYLQSTPFRSHRLHKLALPFYPAAVEALDLAGYGLVLSSSSRFAKGIRPAPGACHVCYCHTPARFAWRPDDYFGRSARARLLWPLLWPMLARLRAWDRQSAARVDFFVANSRNVAGRIHRAYGREATVIEPPVETSRFRPVPSSEIGDALLVVSRLVGYKRVDIAVAACSRLGLPLQVVGSGPEEAALRRGAGPTVRFLGRLPDAEVAEMMARCRALIFPGEEDFGIAPLEAMAAGRPVVAYGAGGALETVIPGETGMLFAEPTADSLAETLRQLDAARFAPEALRMYAERFDAAVFRDRITGFVAGAVEDHRLRAGISVRVTPSLQATATQRKRPAPR